MAKAALALRSKFQGPRLKYCDPRSTAQGPDPMHLCPRTTVRGPMRMRQVPRTVELGTGCFPRLYSLLEGLLGPFSLSHRALNSTPSPLKGPPRCRGCPGLIEERIKSSVVSCCLGQRKTRAPQCRADTLGKHNLLLFSLSRRILS